MNEPSVLDYLKSRLAPWKNKPPVASIDSSAPLVVSAPEVDLEESITLQTKRPAGPISMTWRSPAGLFLAIAAQGSAEPRPNRTWFNPVAFFTVAGSLAAWASWRGEWVAPAPPAEQAKSDPMTVKVIPLVAGLAAAGLAFLASGGNLFTWLNLVLWLVGISCTAYAFWIPSPAQKLLDQPGLNDVLSMKQPRRIPASWLMLFMIMLMAVFFRFYSLSQVPLEMNSDHAEKIMDIFRVLNGQTSIFFPNNGGREALQMYLVAGLHKFFNVNLDFMSLKMVTATVGLLTLPFIYLLGKEIANERVGIIATAFASVAYWPNVISRLGLRLPFYSLFTALVLYLLIRGIRTANRNLFILAGLFLGLSLFGYSADRVLPLVLLVAIGFYMLHPIAKGKREQVAWFTILSFMMAALAAVPLLRYVVEQPEAFFYRSLTRLSGIELSLAQPAWSIFFKNLGRAMAMFSWSDGEVWTASIPFRPALDIVAGALFWLGFIIILVAYLQRRHWLHLFLLVSIPLLMLPSTLALAFPIENPNLYRTAGAMVPAFLFTGISLDGFMSGLERRMARPGVQLGWALALVLFAISSFQSYGLVFNQYRQQYQLSSWNTSEMGQVVREFTGTYGGVDNVWIMGYPYWVDARLVGINSGYPLRNFAMFVENLNELPENSGAKLFLVKPEDHAAADALQARFPNGILNTYQSETPGKDFLIFFVPPAN